jgi:hypothetical protein
MICSRSSIVKKAKESKRKQSTIGQQLETFAPLMSAQAILRLGTVKGVAQFQEHLKSHYLTICCDAEITSASDSPLRTPIHRSGLKIGNRIAVQPMEGMGWHEGWQSNREHDSALATVWQQRRKTDLGR